MEKLLRTGVLFLLHVLVFVLLVDPADRIFRLKVPVFVLTFVLWILGKALSGSLVLRRDSVLFVLGYIAIPIAGIVVAVMQNNFDNPAFAIGFVKSVMILNLLFVLDDYQIRFDKILVHMSVVLPILTIVVYILFLVDQDYFNKIVFAYFTEETGSASFSLRSFYGFNLAMFYFKSSPLLVFPLGYCIHQLMTTNRRFKYLFLSVILVFTMFLSGTRANILSAMLIVVILVFYYLVRKRNKLPLVVSSVAVLYLLGLFIVNASFAEKDVSQEIKGNHLTSYVSLFTNEPVYLLWGQGLGSEFYSKGFGYFTPQTELTYFDVVRMFGIPLGAVFLLLTLYPLLFLVSIYPANKKAIYTIVAYVAYLFIAGTNPLLVSSTGIVAILSVFCFMRSVEVKIKN